MSQAYTVKPSEIRALSDDARRRLAEWDRRVRALPAISEKPQRPSIGVQAEMDIAPAQERRPLPAILTLAGTAERRLAEAERLQAESPHDRGSAHKMKDALDRVESAWGEQGWQQQRAECAVIRWPGGEMHVTPDRAADMMRALTRGPAEGETPRKRAPRAIRAIVPAQAEDVRTPAAIAATAPVYLAAAPIDAQSAAPNPYADWQAGIDAAREALRALGVL